MDRDVNNPYAAPQSELAETDAAQPLATPNSEIDEHEVRVVTQLTVKDWQAYQTHWKTTQLPRVLPLLGMANSAVLWLAITFGFLVIYTDPWSLGALGVAALLLAGLLNVLVNRIRERRALTPSVEGMFLGKHEFTFSDKGIRDRARYCDTTTHWHVISAIEEAESLIVFSMGDVGAFVIPKRYLNEKQRFFDAVTQMWTQAKSED